MKRSRGKEGVHRHPAGEPQEKSSPDTILVFLVLATILLAVSALSSFHLDFPPTEEITSPEHKPDTYVWITGTSTLREGLYLFTPEQLKEEFPGLLPPDAEEAGINGSEQRVLAIQYNGDYPEVVNLPPEVANIFFQPISVNRADKNILSTLPGIGPVLADRIVQRRKEKGPFRSVDEILQIPGIGPGKLAQLHEHILID
jgi:competence ComEA-like helix-hairpin-helix protein